MLKEGTVLDGKYEILRRIGEGGMSIVYLARNNRMNMQLAVKEIKNDGSKSMEILLKGLEREANILKNVDHPVIPRIVDIVKHGGTICVVMDFIEGENLADKLKEVGSFSQEQVIEWGLELASALDYLHSMNPPIIYRDMKPSNVMLKPDGGVKLIDFGTAKTYDIENNADTTALGTRGYAAPEQFGDAFGRGIYKTDARTDIYNLGATLYHMVTGKNPQEPPYEMVPIRQVNMSLSTGLEEIILKCTKPNPNERYQSCSELIYALEHYTELDESYIRQNRKKVTLFAATAALTMICALLSVGGKVGMNRKAAENYSAYVEAGDMKRVEGDYTGAALEYKKAFDLNEKETDAYIKFIDLYIDAHSDVESTSGVDLNSGLTVIANKIKDGVGGVDENNEVLYRMGLAYFVELKDPKTAAKYFTKVDPEDEVYGQLAGYYGHISTILMSANPNPNELIQNVDEFAEYNKNNISNDNEQKFINYKTIGSQYTTYLSVEGVPEKSIQRMEEALEALDSYTGDGQADYAYEFSRNLAETYFQYGQSKITEEGDVTEAKDDLLSSVDYYQEVVDLISGKVNVGATTSNETVKGYITSYVVAMNRIAEIYGLIGDKDKAVEAYKKAEADLGEGNPEAKAVYAAHLYFLYSIFKNTNQDPAKWTADQKREILEVYHNGNKIDGIQDNQTWRKRSSDMENLESGMGSSSKDKADDKNSSEEGE
ncbi:MAG: serine/threonine protein kinase [Eubacterium sp.]|nr:serine/threonine protein kinase [Eubacterium sp.]